MQKKVFWLVILAIACVACFALEKKSVKASNEVDVNLNISKDVVQLGETLSIETRITKNASVPIYLEGDSNYAVAIKIAFKEDKDYKLYVPKGPLISLDGVYMPIQINPKETLDNQITVLWNNKPKVSHLNADAAKPYVEGRILTDYAFPEAGTYYIKAVTTVLKDKKPVSVESEPIKIIVEEPQGEDLEVWKKIKDNGEFAYFIQEGEITRGYHKPEEQAKFQQEVDDIVNHYPNSFLSGQIKQSLVKFQAQEAKKKAYLEKMNKPE